MTGFDVAPPMPPSGKKEQKKGLFKKLFGNKKEEKKSEETLKTEAKKEEPKSIPKKEESKKVIKEEPKDSSSVKLDIDSINKDIKQGKKRDLDDITNLIDQTINEIKDLQTKNKPGAKPPAPIPPSKPEVKEPKPIPKKEIKKIEPKKLAPKPVVAPKPVKPIAPKKEVKKPSPIKQIQQKLTGKKFDLPSDFSGIKQGITKDHFALPSGNIDKQIKAVKTKISDMPITTATHPFHLEGGKVIHNLTELASALQTCSDEVFHHHVTGNKNDFATWIKTQMKNPEVGKHVGTFMLKEDVVRVIREEANKVSSSMTQKKTLEQQLISLNKAKIEQDKKKFLSKSPKDFFKLNNKTIKDIEQLHKAITKISDKDFTNYVSVNKQAMTKWISYLTKDFAKEAKDINANYKDLHGSIIKQVNTYIDTKTKAAEKKASIAKTNAIKYEGMAKQMQLKNDSLIKAIKNTQVRKDSALKELSSIQLSLGNNRTENNSLRTEHQKLTTELSTVKKDLLSERSNHKKLMNQERKGARDEVADLQKQIKIMHSTISKDKKVIEKDWNKLKNQKIVITSRENKVKHREDDAHKREIKLAEEQSKVEIMKSKFEDQKKEIDVKRSELEVEGFQKYLEAKLKNVELINDQKMPEVKETTVPFQGLIDSCKQSVMEGNVQQAKSLYLELKSKFESSNLEGAQKELVYNSIRELYDDIMLSL